MLISNPHYGRGIRLRSLTRYESFIPVHFSSMASSDIPAHNATIWHVILYNFVTLDSRTYLLNRLTNTFIACCSHFELHEWTMPSLA